MIFVFFFVFYYCTRKLNFPQSFSFLKGYQIFNQFSMIQFMYKGITKYAKKINAVLTNFLT